MSVDKVGTSLAGLPSHGKLGMKLAWTFTKFGEF
jgi:hypothetical protein